ncbi:MAG: MOSC N-terminal beta barrel domain-containing protein [Polaromonas sp.]|uniref:MOSC domain-containing protein n=1 Tax=Polaromonas sp. TaxID=1869339 RepID=UPI00271E1C6D|nr:MOSC N-terminal beta barrel domain-containing protein [Polaromonas sp.]MDO9113828.1 MOSC N-terminal beta barrel domain-containing protein [Polaromonas sp.]MDP1888449.1 MOSC N-terminal beta barrel domain-containing protein [Polaromonas sp.]
MSETSVPASGDVGAVITGLWVYPVKSCAGVQVQEAILTETGLEFDRAWMVVDDDGSFLTQRELPRMALIQPQLKTHDMVLRAPGMLALHIALDQVQEPLRVTIWDEEVKAYDMGPIAAQWFSDFLGVKARLVRFDPEEKRASSREWTGGVEALNQFSDGYPVLVLSEASLAGLNEKLQAGGHAAVGMARFRPNIVIGDVPGASDQAPHDEDRLDLLQIGTEQGVVQLKPVKPCPRCPIPNIDPATAQSSPEVGDTLQTYRQDPRLKGAVSFGMNAIVLQGNDHLLRVGQSVTASYNFD